MTCSRSNLALLIILVILAVASYGLLQLVESGKIAPQTTSESVADLVIRDFNATRYGPSGEPVQRLRAARMDHFSHRESQLWQPHITGLVHGQAQWEVWSEQATLSADGNLAHLLGQAHLRQYKDELHAALHIDSSEVRLDIPANFAQTEQWSTIYHIGGQTSAMGMAAWLNEKRLDLRAQVHTTYHPQTHHE